MFFKKYTKTAVSVDFILKIVIITKTYWFINLNFIKIKVCCWSNCKSKFSEYILKRIENDKTKLELENLVIEKISCMWKCEDWPNISINWNIFSKQNPIKASQLVLKKLKNENTKYKN